MPGVFRRAERDGDAALLLDLFRHVHGDALAALDPTLRDPLLQRQAAGQTTSYRAAFPGSRFEVVEIGGRPVGRMITHAGGAAHRLVDLALLPDWRGRGIGTAMIRSLQAEARNAGLPLRLSVMASNADARRLYARLGFVVERNDDVAVAMRWQP